VKIKCVRSMTAALRIALLGLMALMIRPGESLAQTATIQIVITKAEFIFGVEGGGGTLNFRGYQYPLTVGGVSLGASIGISTTQLVGTVSNIFRPEDIVGTYSAVGGGVAVIVGGGGVQMQNARGVILNLQGSSVGLDFSLNVSGITIGLR
jgi:hypothetical protein